MSLPFSAPIVGAKFRPPAADVLNNLPGETELICVREPLNPHDANAIKVCLVIDPGKDPDLVDIINDLVDSDTYPEDWQMEWMEEPYHFHLGFVPRDKAEMLAPYLDKMGGTCPAKLSFNMEGRPQVEMSIEDGESDTTT